MDRIGRDHFHSELAHAMGQVDPETGASDIAIQSFRSDAE